MAAKLNPRAHTVECFSQGYSSATKIRCVPHPLESRIFDKGKTSAARKRCLYRKALRLCLKHSSIRFNTSLPAASAALRGFDGFISRATASGSIRSPRPRSSTDSVSVDLPDPFGPATSVRVGGTALKLRRQSILEGFRNSLQREHRESSGFRTCDRPAIASLPSCRHPCNTQATRRQGSPRMHADPTGIPLHRTRDS